MLGFLLTSRLLKNGHLRRFPHPSSLRRTAKYTSFLRISGALHLAIFEQPEKDDFFSSLLNSRFVPSLNPAIPPHLGKDSNSMFRKIIAGKTIFLQKGPARFQVFLSSQKGEEDRLGALFQK